MRKFLCKVFSFLLNLVSQLVDLVANTLIKIGTAVVEVLSEVAGAVGNAFLKNPVVLGVLLFTAYIMFKPPPDDEKSKQKGGVIGDSLNELTT